MAGGVSPQQTGTGRHHGPHRAGHRPLTVELGSGVSIAAPISVVCDGNVEISSSELRIAPGASLALYVQGNLTIDWSSQVNTALAVPRRRTS